MLMRRLRKMEEVVDRRSKKDFFDFSSYYKEKEKNRLKKLNRKRIKKHKKKFAKA